MNTARLGTALLAGHILVASIAWTMGWIAGRLCQRRIHDFDCWLHALAQDELDLRDPALAYDWEIDGECLAEVDQ